MKQIDIAFSQVADATTKPPVLVLQAMGGQGKSQIALEYCRRSRSRFQAIFWIDATSDASVQGGFERIAKKFDPLAATGPRDRDEKIDLVQKKLANLEEEWLLVFDNYDDLSSYKLRPYLPTSKQPSFNTKSFVKTELFRWTRLHHSHQPSRSVGWLRTA